jgi:RimJ/RimL family protein N-acetyltransferase
MNDQAAMSPDHTIVERRQLIRSLLAPTNPWDALTSYYALQHDAKRTQLTVHLTPADKADGFVAVCQTGQDLFVPIVVLRASQETAVHLLRQALHPRRPYRIISMPLLRDVVQKTMLLERQQINHIYTLNASAFRRVINVMVQPGREPFRFEIRTDDRIVAAAGINWRSDKMAELYVYVAADARHRGWGRSVAAASVSALIEAGLLPVYAVAESNASSKRLAQRLGFRDSGAREFECLGCLRE